MPSERMIAKMNKNRETGFRPRYWHNGKRQPLTKDMLDKSIENANAQLEELDKATLSLDMGDDTVETGTDEEDGL